MDIYILKGDQQVGPFDVDQLLSQGLTPEMLVWYEGLDGWQPAADAPVTAGLVPRPKQPVPQPQPQPAPPPQPQPQVIYVQTPPPPPGQTTAVRDNNDAFASGPEGKSRGVTALLAIFLGGLGIQYFYLGKVGGGFLCILLTIVTCGWWAVLTLIQGIVLFCMDNETFRRKFVLSNSTFPVF